MGRSLKEVRNEGFGLDLGFIDLLLALFITCLCTVIIYGVKVDLTIGADTNIEFYINGLKHKYND